PKTKREPMMRTIMQERDAKPVAVAYSARTYPSSLRLLKVAGLLAKAHRPVADLDVNAASPACRHPTP
ncbi:hypothetical protein Q2334_27295, partial [Escherichia coli]|nr:hypothetical protein [Escherichia coli]